MSHAVKPHLVTPLECSVLSHCLCVSAAVTEALLTNVPRRPPSGPPALQTYSLTLPDTPKGSRRPCHIRKLELRGTEGRCVAAHSRLAAARLRAQARSMPSQPPPLRCSATSCPGGVHTVAIKLIFTEPVDGSQAPPYRGQGTFRQLSSISALRGVLAL